MSRRNEPAELFDLPQQKALPHSEESERAALGGAMLDANEVMPVLASRLVAEDFYSDRHQVLCRAMLDLHKQGDPIDLRTIQAILEQRDELQLIGGLAYLTGLDLDLPDVGRVDTYVEIIKERSIRRQLIKLSGETIRDCMDGGLEARAALQKVSSRVSDLAGSVARPAARPLSRLVEDFADLVDHDGVAALQGISTGYRDLDSMGVSLAPGRVIVVAGRPGMGKTSFAINVLRNIGHRGHASALFSLEMDALADLTPKFICLEADIPWEAFKAGRLSRKQWSAYGHAVAEVARLPIHIVDPPRLTFGDFEAETRRLVKEEGIQVVGLDYFQLVRDTSRKYESQNAEFSAMSAAMKQLAGELGITALVLSRMNRENERRGGDMRPRLGDLYGSGSLESDADLVAFFHRPEVYDPQTEARGICEFLNRKSRFGPTGVRELGFDGPTGRFFDLDRPQPAQAAADPF